MPTDPSAIRDWVASLSQEDLAQLAQQAISGQLASSLLGFSPGGQPSNDITLPDPPSEASLLTVTIELHGSKPRIWRRLTLPGHLTLDAVHPLLQAAMGWTDSHLHRFELAAERRFQAPYFLTEFDIEEGDEGTAETDARLDQVLRAPGDRLTYLYDFGDGWEHRITLESLTPLTADNREPACLKGAKACPPEDVGGMGGHDEIAAWLRAGAPADAVPTNFDDAEHAREWLPLDYDPDAFDAAETTEAMRRWASGDHLPWHALPDPLADLVQRVRGEGWSIALDWLAALGARGPVVLGDAEARLAARPWEAIMDAVGPGVALTAAGYLPPTVVERVARDAGIAQWWIGKANREDLTPPVAVLRETAQRLGLLRKAKGRLTPTARAKAAAGDPRALVAAVVERLPLGSGFESDAGWCHVLGVAAGASGPELEHGTITMLRDLGWAHRDGSPLGDWEVHSGARGTIEALESMSGGRRAVDAALAVTIGRAILFGLAHES